MRIDILTLFPEMFSPLNFSILKRAQDDGIVKINLVNIRDFAKPPHYKCDDYPFGGGAGMIMLAEPLFNAIESVLDDEAKIFYMSPRGCVFNQNKAKDMSKLNHIILICGHYEGIDNRVIEHFKVEELSIGEYILTGGELASMVVADAVSRLISGVISDESTQDETFSSDNRVEYDQYTRPANFRGLKVPDVLLSGNHAKIEEWKIKSSDINTKKRENLKDIKNN